MAEENNKSEEVRFSQEQYDMLKRCSDKQDITEWNEWRKKNPDEKILLREAGLEKATLWRANLQEAELGLANLQKARLGDANLQEAFLGGANLQEAKLQDANLQGAKLFRANLQEADLWRANLQGAKLEGANLKGTDLERAKIKGANFRKAIVDGETLVWDCEIDKGTYFSGVGLDAIRIQPGAKQLLEYNNRRMNWKGWYKEHKFLQWPVKWFWSLSDYGISTGRILGWFMFFALIFAMIYYVWGCVDVYGLGIKDRPGVVSNLFVLEKEHGNEAVAWNQVPVRSIYFSVITMTTLGFGDMYANPATSKDNPYAQARSGWGHFLLMIQVLLGYVMLGALVTRFAVLFTAGGPAGEFREAENRGQNADEEEDDGDLHRRTQTGGEGNM
ncbi:pentapeptide repeat-containing protein [candidate division KSB1 bacterium]|nr:pentapeptide repeat-containing protein [candidate division KSB1 bacterium]